MLRNGLRHGVVAAAILPLAILIAAAGCSDAQRPGTAAPPSTTAATDAPVTSSPTPPTPPTGATTGPDLPTMGPPTAPPKTPSDPQPVAILVGRIVASSNGPCYRLENDEGVVFAVHNASAGPLANGTTVRVYTAPARQAMQCGPGRRFDATKIEVIR
jgi:hypothetical protein